MKGVLSLVAINVVFRHPKSLNKKTIYFGPKSGPTRLYVELDWVYIFVGTAMLQALINRTFTRLRKISATNSR